MMDLIPGVNASASALQAEKIRMDVIAQNIANANTTKDLDGKAYKRKLVEFEAMLQRVSPNDPQKAVSGVRVAGIVQDPNPGPLVYDPSHPHADKEGFVRMPNVKVHREMVDLISTSRAYEANLSVVKTSRQMARQALSIGR
jgi:flagellar basal-body rod protein FlgC